jgi:ATP-dependent DNA helicase RecQ
VFFIERSTVSEEALKAVARRIVAAAAPVSPAVDGGSSPAAGGSSRAVGGSSPAAGESPPAAKRFDLAVAELLPIAGEEEVVRAIVGHLARAGVVQPAPSAPDRVAGRLAGPWDGRALVLCRASAQEGTRVRWRQYRSVWAWVEGSKCRREGILRHFGDHATPSPTGPCCDVCDPALAPAPPPPPAQRAPGARPAQLAHRPPATGELEALDEAILDVVASAQPEVGRTRAVEILRGGHSKVVVKYSYDGLPHYGAWSHLASAAVLARVDALLTAGTLRSTGGRYPKLEVA